MVPVAPGIRAQIKGIVARQTWPDVRHTMVAPMERASVAVGMTMRRPEWVFSHVL